MTIPYETPTPGVTVEITGSRRSLRGLVPGEIIDTIDPDALAAQIKRNDEWRAECEKLRKQKLGLLGRVWEWFFGRDDNLF